MMELTKIAILGPRGNVGTAILTELLHLQPSTHLHITALTRPNTSYIPPTPPPNSLITLTHHAVNFSSPTALTTAFGTHTCIINAISGSAVQYTTTKLIIDAAIAAGVKLYFANEFVGHITRPQFRRLPESAVGAKVRIRGYLEQVAAEGMMDWVSLNGGPFFDMWLMKGPAGFDVKRRKARIYGTGENKLLWTPLAVMAKAVVNIVRSYPRAEVVNRAIYIAPIRDLTQNRILEGLNSVILDMEREQRDKEGLTQGHGPSTSQGVLGEFPEGGKNVFEVEYVDVQKINENALIALERGEVAKAMKGLAISNQFYEGDSGNDFSELVINEVVGVPEMSVEEAIKNTFRRYGMDCEVVPAMWKVEPCEI